MPFGAGRSARRRRVAHRSCFRTDITGMQNCVAWVHGDTIAEHLGVTPVGLPTGAGYSAGNRLVDAYLAATGKSAAQALHADSAEVIATALAADR
ncbi:DUF2268 domain-containing putative Zn-dependent protease [Nocardia sp. NPDC050799]|uniref:DUF2268 domain-containing putative Zn-dependent protease n=1 Tax=Nocardia sp. NPDC050799 TaxID=3154842 RepID=UPI0033F47FA5